jgi:Bacterial Ig-like domain (group 3)
VQQAVTFTAVLTSAHGPIPDGEVITFYAHATPIGTGITTGGVAKFATSSLHQSTYNIHALYPGDATFRSSSGVLQEVVNGYPNFLSFGMSPNPSTYGQAVTFQVFVYPSQFPDTFAGTVKFVWDRFTIGSAAVSNTPYFFGEAYFTTSMLNADTYPMMAVYSGDAENASNTSDVINLVVLPTTSAATLTSSANPSNQGQAVTFTARITSPTVTPRGPVTFTIGTTVLGTAQLSQGKAMLTTSSLPAGKSIVTVTYAGDSNIARSTAYLTQVVQ